MSHFGRRNDYLTPHGQRNTPYLRMTHANAYAIIKFTATNSININPTGWLPCNTFSYSILLKGIVTRCALRMYNVFAPVHAIRILNL